MRLGQRTYVAWLEGLGVLAIFSTPPPPPSLAPFPCRSAIGVVEIVQDDLGKMRSPVNVSEGLCHLFIAKRLRIHNKGYNRYFLQQDRSFSCF